MSTYSVQILPDAPVILSTAFDTWRVSTDMTPFVEEFLSQIQQIDHPVYYIADLTAWQPNFNDVVMAANQSARSANAMLHHPMVREFLVVTDMRLVDLAAKGLNADVFGNVPVKVFQTLDDALAYARTA